MTLHAITVLGRDRPGIIAETMKILDSLGLNLEDSTMTLLRGHFAMMVVCAGDAADVDVEAALLRLTTDGSLEVSVSEVPDSDRPPAARAAYVLTVHGGDRPGIVSAVLAEVAATGGNVTHLTTRLSHDHYVVAAEVDLPGGDEVDAGLRADLLTVAARLGVCVTLREVGSDDL